MHLRQRFRRVRAATQRTISSRYTLLQHLDVAATTIPRRITAIKKPRPRRSRRRALIISRHTRLSCARSQAHSPVPIFHLLPTWCLADQCHHLSPTLIPLEDLPVRSKIPKECHPAPLGLASAGLAAPRWSMLLYHSSRLRASY